MIRLLPLSLLLLSVSLACKPKGTTLSDERSITLRDQEAGKWLATVSIGGAVGREETLYLSEVLKKTFASTQGGGYRHAFHISDKDGPKPSKAFILARFADLKQKIADYRKKFPKAPTMLVLSLTGHGFSKSALPTAKEEFLFQVNSAADGFTNPADFFTGPELAQLIADLAVDETIVFIQSCLSGNFARVNFVAQYGRVLADTAARLKTNIAVITPVNEFVLSPVRGIEPILESTFSELRGARGDFATYADFKDTLVRKVCESDHYLPRTSFADTSAVEAILMAGRAELAAGLEPQFFENISANLPLVLTANGLKKYDNRTLVLPVSSGKVQNVPVSSATEKVCAERRAFMAKRWSGMESERVRIKSIYNQCAKEEAMHACIDQKLSAPQTTPIK